MRSNGSHKKEKKETDNMEQTLGFFFFSISRHKLSFAKEIPLSHFAISSDLQNCIVFHC